MSERTMQCRRCKGTGREPDPRAEGQALRAAREARGLGVRELARRVGCSAAYVSDLEYGRRATRGPKANALRKALGLR